MRLAPASMEFSTSSLTMEAGRSTTSLAAICAVTGGQDWDSHGIQFLTGATERASNASDGNVPIGGGEGRPGPRGAEILGIPWR